MGSYAFFSLGLFYLDMYVVTAQYPATEDSHSPDKIIEYQIFVESVYGCVCLWILEVGQTGLKIFISYFHWLTNFLFLIPFVFSLSQISSAVSRTVMDSRIYLHYKEEVGSLP